MPNARECPRTSDRHPKVDPEKIARIHERLFGADGPQPQPENTVPPDEAEHPAP